MKKGLNLNELIWLIILLGFTYYFSSLLISGNIADFIHPKMFKYVKFSIVVFIILSINQLRNLFSYDEDEEIRWGYFLFAIPLILGIAVKPAGLNAEGAHMRGVSLTSSFHHQHELDEKYLSYNEITMNDENYFDVYELMFNRMDEMKGKKVTVTGFVYKGEGLKSQQFINARMAMNCCAADSQLIGVLCSYGNDKALPEGQWIEVTGTIDESYADMDGNGSLERVPLIQVEKLRTVKEPDNKYIYHH